MPKIISSSYQKVDGVKGYILKQLYCPNCNEEIFGQFEPGPRSVMWAGGYYKPFWWYQCFNCGWQVTGSEAEFLHAQFIEDLI